ncbi:ammonia-dependent NAD(+) synthetase [Terribacillus saccharophilus]|uniref:ammonia-dependent NAD(+) synthetase n=1 Tax=Terribacillus saccharophilus TaxID=361277 RepID=UPI003981C8C4
MSNQTRIIEELQVKPTIDAKQEIRSRIDFLKEYLLKTGAKGFVLGISGGQDSTLAGRLAQLAIEELKKEGKDVTFAAVRLPYGEQADEEDAQLAMKFIDPAESYVYNIKEPVLDAAAAYEDAAGEKLADYHKGNIKARMRMIAQYAIGGQKGLLVLGTDHAAEAITGFFTKYGDGGADVLPLSGLNKRQGKQLLIELGAPERLYEKLPTADLLDDKPGQADETELGLKYEDIDDYLEGKIIDEKTAKLLEDRYMKTTHKRHQPASIHDDWWKEL